MAASSPEHLNQITFTVIPCTDISRVQKFHGSVFGWTFTPAPELPDHQVGVVTEVLFSYDNMRGGFIQVKPEDFFSAALHPDGPSHSRLSIRFRIYVESVKATLAKVKEAGGDVYL